MNIRKFLIQPPLEKMAPPVAHYSYGFRVSDGIPLFLAGIVSTDRENRVVGKGDMRAQLTQILENIEILLEEAGGTLDDVVKITIYTVAVEDYLRTTRGLMKKYFKENPPASTLVEVKRLANPDFLIEIESIAFIPKQEA
jgi:enamine deaminase RidA (YjgF/YER057c/UK114 family)